MIQDVTNFQLRQSQGYCDELRIYKASIYKTLGPNDDRLQVRILPYMMDIPDDELDNLPKYPAFVKGQVIAGASEYEDGENASRVYVAATPDFTFGFVLCLASEFEANNTSKYSQSYNFQEIVHYLSQRQALPEEFEYKDIHVSLNMQANGYGGVMIFYHIKTGDYFILNTSGSLFTVQTDKIYMRVGSPSDPPGTPANFSSITMTADQVSLKAPSLILDAKNIVLGEHGLYLVGTNSEIGVAVDAVSLVPVKSVAV